MGSIVDVPAQTASQALSQQSGTLTLVSGVATVSGITGMTSSSKVFVSPLTPIGTLGAEYKVVPTTGGFTVTAETTGLGTQILDNSVLQYLYTL